MANKINKPKTQRAQIDMLWDIVVNGLQHRVRFLDIKLNFILAFIALILALLGVTILR